MKPILISKLWSTGIRKLLRPTELLRGVVAGCRLAWDSLLGVDKILTDNTPTGYGHLYDTIRIPLSNITRNDIAESTSTGGFTYKLSGAPKGIIHFTSSPNKLGAAKYYDFLECDGYYIFKEDPTTFGIVTTKDDLSCIFTITTVGSKTLGFQDITNKYANSTEYSDNSVIRRYDASAPTTNGISNRMYLLSSGVTVAETESKIVKQWTEGGVLLALTESGELLRDPYGKITKYLTIPAGTPLTDKVYSQYCLYPAEGITKVYDPDYGTSELKHILPELADILSEVSKDTIYRLLELKGYITIDTTKGHKSVQFAVAKRTNPVSNLYLCQKINVTYTSETAPTHAYLYFDGSPEFSIPFIFRGMSKNQAILNNCDRYSVIAVPLQLLATNTYAAITDNGERYGRSVTCGMYLKSIALATEQSSGLCAIVTHINMSHPEMVNAGCCIYVNITKREVVNE